MTCPPVPIVLTDAGHAAAVARRYIERWNEELEHMSPADRTKAALLAFNLAVAVPLWVERYREMCWEEALRRSKICAQVVAEKGDIILYRGKGTAEAFNRLAEALAIASSLPGGITFHGQHWESPRLRTLAEMCPDLFPQPDPT